MSSKIWTLVIGILIGTMIGCAGENQFSMVPSKVKFDAPKFQCLKNFDSTVADFMNGTLANRDVENFWNCLDFAVVQFVKFVHGDMGSSYSPLKLAEFVDQFFLDGSGFHHNRELLAELMEIKRVFVGGRLDSVTHYDLYVRTRALIKEFKAATLDLNPHMKVLRDGLGSSSKKSGLGTPDVEAAIAALKRAGDRIGRLVHEGQGFYSFSHLNAFVTQLEKYMRQREPDFEFKNTKKYLPLFAELKGFLVAQPYDLIRHEDWPRLFGAMTDVMGWTLRYRLDIEEQDWDQGHPLDVLETIVNEAMATLEMSILDQPKQEFAYLDMDRLADLLEELNFIPLDIDGKTLKDVLRRLGSRALASDGSDSGWDRKDIGVIKGEIARWFSAQRYITQVAIKDERVETLTGGPGEMAALMQSPFALKLDAEGRIEFSMPAIRQGWDRHSLTTLNWQRAIIRLLMRGYTTQTSPDGAAGLTLEQLVLVANDWQALAQKLGLFDAGRAEATAKKIFMESNLFVPSSNGDDRIDFKEAVQYLAYAISGLNGSDHIRAELLKICPDPSAPKKLKAACFRQELLGRRGRLLDQFPIFLSDIGGSADRFNAFMNNVESTTRDGVNDQPFARGDLVEQLVLMQFIETFFLKFDSGDQRINVEESLTAYPIFKRSLDEIVKSSYGLHMGNDDLESLFTFFFRYGQPPQSSLGGILKFLNWRWHPENWSYNEDRVRVAQILAELNARR